MSAEIRCGACGFTFPLTELRLADEQQRMAAITGRLPEVVVGCRRPFCEERIRLTDAQVEQLLSQQ